MNMAKFYQWSLTDIKELTLQEWNSAVAYMRDYQNTIKRANKRR